jgi:hypothetical protein
MERDHHLRVVSRYVLDDEFVVDLVAVPTLVCLLIEHHITHDVYSLCHQIIRVVCHGSYGCNMVHHELSISSTEEQTLQAIDHR